MEGLVLLSSIAIIVGLVNILSSNSMVNVLISLEISTCALYILSTTSSVGGGESVSSASFLSMCAMEGVVGLVIVVNMYRNYPFKGIWSVLI